MRDKILDFFFGIARRLIIGKELRNIKRSQEVANKEDAHENNRIVKFTITIQGGSIEFMTDDIYMDFVQLYLESMENSGFITKEELEDARVEYKVFKLGALEESDRND